MTTVPPPICVGCTHRRGQELACDAFPEGIPGPIIRSEFDHRESFPGDGGITFDPVDDVARQRAVRLFDADDI